MEKNSIKIFGNDYSTKDGTGERDYIHIQDLVDGHMLAMNKIRDVENFEFYNLGTGNPVSVLELIDTFNSVNNLAVEKNFVDRRKGDVEVCFADPAKAYKELNWQAKLTLEEIVSLFPVFLEEMIKTLYDPNIPIEHNDKANYCSFC